MEIVINFLDIHYNRHLMRPLFEKKCLYSTGFRLIICCFAIAMGTANSADEELLRLLRQEESRPPLEARITAPAPDPVSSTTAPGPIVAPPIQKKKLFDRSLEGATVEDQRRQLGGAIPSPNLPKEEPRIKPVETPSWQTKYTVGPGDTLNISIYDRPTLAREVPISPDGKVSYLQAVGVKIQGLTLREVREKLLAELSTYHKSIKLIVTPGTIGSKKFSVIGRVREPGSFPLDRPTSVLEAIAAAQGIEVGAIGGSAFELADLDRSFVARQGRKLDIDISRLYFQGDFSQNALLEPNDYIYVASSLRNEYYILGAVNAPGRRKMPTKMTVLRAITESGGFEDKAYRGNVLLIRGSIHNPETTVVNVQDILTGAAADVPIENRDIIFVHKRPFHLAENALDSALATFVQTVSAEVINQNYNPLSISAGN